MSFLDFFFPLLYSFFSNCRLSKTLLRLLRSFSNFFPTLSVLGVGRSGDVPAWNLGTRQTWGVRVAQWERAMGWHMGRCAYLPQLGFIKTLIWLVSLQLVLRLNHLLELSILLLQFRLQLLHFIGYHKAISANVRSDNQKNDHMEDCRCQ